MTFLRYVLILGQVLKERSVYLRRTNSGDVVTNAHLGQYAMLREAAM